ncbi:carboxypeptidase regulatory-like domain-containing protein [Parapedobacter luteus]|uniref:carboxypeptidase regulatory-like domain-containing protein n=1 Tax=Parapedobacter luteus TaxID=623280 RepID=UPI0009A645DD|nr:carboxypeptidase regulatory-like domain-containing protein [Parapedobacter luteus]
MYRLLNLLLLFPLVTFSQFRIITGIVSDESGAPLGRANVMAKALGEDGNVKFAMANAQGQYNFTLDASKAYLLSVSYIGYHPDSTKLDPSNSNLRHDFKLRTKNEQLREIIIEHEYRPVIIKKDTIVFNVEAFAAGNERKLKDVLGKLPGVEVDRDGRVTFNGQPIRHMLVEGKKFFGGGSKLAVENIPADALDQIEVIDHFNEVGFLKEVSGTDEMAMNVKLKEDRKRLVFGDLEAGGGNGGHHLGHAALFYYTPAHNVSVIGDINDIGKSVFTFDDMMRFQGGVSAFVNTNSRPSFTNLNTFTSDNRDVVENRSRFAALNFSSDVVEKLNVSGFAIFSRLLTDRRADTYIEYLTNQGVTNEERFAEQGNDDLMGLANAKLDYSPSNTEKWYYNAQWQSSGNSLSNLLNSVTNLQNSYFNTLSDADNHSLKQYIEWHKAYNVQHTTTFVVNHVYEKNTPLNTWINDQAFLVGFIPLETDDQYRIEQLGRQRSNSVDALFKHYWVINSRHQLHSNIGNNFARVDLLTSERQLLSDGSVNSFAEAGFGNDVLYRLNDAFVGLDYKFITGPVSNTASLYGHWYALSTAQTDGNHRLSRFLPEPTWKSEYEIRENERIVFDYQYANSFPRVGQLNSRFTLTSYNAVARGNALLANERYHRSALRYTRFTGIGGPIANASITFNRKVRAIRNELQFEGINHYSMPVLTDNPETNWMAYGSYSNRVAFFRVGGNVRLSWFDYSQTVNDILANNRRTSHQYTVNMRTEPSDWPRASVAYTKGFNRFRGNTSSRFTTDQLDASLDWRLLRDWSAMAEYTYFRNRNTRTGLSDSYHVANAALDYQPEHTPWGFRLTANNFLDNRTKVSNSISDFLASEQVTYIMPRVWLLSVRYKL